MTELAVAQDGQRPARAGTPKSLRIAAHGAGGRLRVGVLAGGIALLILLLTTTLFWHLSLALALVVGTVAWQLDGGWIASRTLRLETDLADLLDALAANVAAGLSLLEALETAARGTKPALREPLLGATGRLRLGDSPGIVFADVQRAVPLPTMRLLCQFLIAQWQGGGSLARGLGSIAEIVRDRIALARRVRSQSAEARFSVFGILGVIYGIAALAYVNNPSRVEAFLGSEVGGGLTALCVGLQSFGLVWMANLGRVEA